MKGGWKGEAIEILALIDKLEEIANLGTRLPGSRKRLVNPESLSELVDQMRVTVPRDIKEAEEVLLRREDLLGQSLVEAKRIRATAESEFRSRLEENELVKEANAKAEKIMEEAQQKAQRILDIADSDATGRRSSSDQYAQDALYQLEQQIAGLLSTVRRGIDVLDAQQKAAAR